MPKIRAQNGCQRCEFSEDIESGDYGMVILWESRKTADDAAVVIAPVLIPERSTAGASPDIRLFDVYEPNK